MNVDQFVAKYNNTHIDEDGYYGAQCWDVVARYAREVVGCPSFPTGSGGAEGLYRLFQNPIPQYFDRIANNPNQIPQKGDVIVWGASFSPPYGHTALVISANTAGTTNLEQNGNNPGGNAYIKTRNWVGVSGWLRPKTMKGNDMYPNKGDIVNLWGAIRKAQPNDNDVAYWTTGTGNPTWAAGSSEVWKTLLYQLADFSATQLSIPAKPSEAEIRSAFQQYGAGEPTAQQISDYAGSPWNRLLDDLLLYTFDRLNRQIAATDKANADNKEQLDKLQLTVDELVKVQKIKDNEIARLNTELAKAGTVPPKDPSDPPVSVDITVKQAINILWKTITDAIKGK